jgi:hypothetical protein
MDPVDRLLTGNRDCACATHFGLPRLIAVTGGPGGGKTAVLEAAQRMMCRHVAFLPESAGIVFGGGFPRVATLDGRRASQRAIFHVQRELERLAHTTPGLAAVLCDRGTIDGSAYWPGDPDEMWLVLGLDPREELLRYHSVLHLRSPDVMHGYNHQNPFRIETDFEARAIDEQIVRAWDGHPNRVIVPSEDDFLAKAHKALAALGHMLPPTCPPSGPSGYAPSA